MSWKNLTIAKKLGAGFGAVLVFLILISGFSIIELYKIGHLVDDSGEMAAGDRFILSKTIDHLNWISRLSDLVFKDDVHVVDLETDHKKCGLGKWLYGDEAKKMAAENEEIARLLEAIKEPHRRLHHSAVGIMDAYSAFDPHLEVLLSQRWLDHLLWAKDLSRTVITGTRFKGGLDPETCPFGKWYHSYQPKNPAIGDLLKGWEAPHKRLHASAAKIVDRMDQNDIEAARTIYQQEILPALEELHSHYIKTIDWIKGAAHRQAETKEIFHSETLPALESTESLLEQIGENYYQAFEQGETLMFKGIKQAQTASSALAAAAIILGIIASALMMKSAYWPGR